MSINSAPGQTNQNSMDRRQFLSEEMKERDVLLRFCLKRLSEEGLNSFSIDTALHPYYIGTKDGQEKIESLSGERIDNTIYWLQLFKNAVANPGVDPELKKEYEAYEH